LALNASNSCLQSQGVRALVISEPKQLYSLMNQYHPSIVVLDEISTNMDCLKLLQTLRNDPRTQHLGIIYISTQLDKQKRISAIELSDSFLNTPPPCSEFVAVVKSVFRRLKQKPYHSDAKEQFWQLLTHQQILYAPTGQAIELTYREMLVLRELASSSNKTVEVKQIVNILGENWLDFEKNRLELLLSRIRSKVKKYNRQENPIKPIRNIGYKLLIPIKVVN
jgi:DNA-binding response OmpR family regulator